MILLKIGSAPGNDIVVNSPYVSALHAEMILLDNGEILIEDKNSSNGTFINGQKLTSNVETPVRRGDLIKFGNVQLQWHQVPVLENPSKYKTILNLGTSQRCDITVNSQFTSRYHATLFVDKKGKCFIQDNKSTNGTEVKGSKIRPEKKIPIKRGDQVIIGDTDVTEELKPFLPNPFGWLTWVGLALGAAAIIVGVIFIIKYWTGTSNNDPDKMTVAQVDALCGNPEKIESASVLVYGAYSIYLELENNPIHEPVWNEISKDFSRIRTGNRIYLTSMTFTGTAFFLDRQGRMGTNRHIAVPWEYEDEHARKEWQSAGEQYMNDYLPGEIRTNEDVAYYLTHVSPFWEMVRLQASVEDQGLDYINSLIRQLRNTKYKLVGETDYFGIAYPGRMYVSTDEFQRCNLLDYSESDEIDLALIQLNDPHTPESVEWVYNPETFNTEKLVPQQDRLMWIGYPNGTTWSLDPKIQQLRPQIRETMCSSTPSKYFFDVQGEIIGGASGSPVYEVATHQLVGVVYARLVDGATYGRVVQAKYLKEMYDKETK